MENHNWQEEFEKKFPHKIAEVIYDFDSTVKTNIKQFISTQIEKAKKEEREKTTEEEIWFARLDADGKITSIYSEDYNACYSNGVSFDIQKVKITRLTNSSYRL